MVKTVMVEEAIMTVKASTVHATTATTIAGQRRTARSNRRPCHQGQGDLAKPAPVHVVSPASLPAGRVTRDPRRTVPLYRLVCSDTPCTYLRLS
jgi:hypothetical protein